MIRLCVFFFLVSLLTALFNYGIPFIHHLKKTYLNPQLNNNKHSFRLVTIANTNTLIYEDARSLQIKTMKLIGVQPITEYSEYAINYIENTIEQNPYIYAEYDMHVKDAKGNILVYIWVTDGPSIEYKLLNALLIENGYAKRGYTGLNRKYKSELIKAESERKKNGKYKVLSTLLYFTK